MQNHRVVRIIARLNVGGPAQHVINLARELASTYPTLLVCGSVAAGEADMLAEAVEQGVDVEVIPALGRELAPWKDLSVMFQLMRIMRRERPSIVHTHTAKAGTLGRIAALVSRVPVRVHTFHGHVFSGYFSPGKTRVFLTIERILAGITTRIVAISESQKKELAGTFRIAPASKITVVQLGLDLEKFEGVRESPAREAVRKEFGVTPDTVLVAIVGRLVPIKNHSLFLLAAADLMGTGRSYHFVIVGDGTERSRLHAEAFALGIAEKITFTGWRTDIERINAGADVMVLCSDNEGTPVSLIEALAAGCPVVATDVGGVRDVLQHGQLGTLVPRGDWQALARAIEHTASQDTGADTDKNAALIRARFGSPRLASDITVLYDQLLGSSRTSRQRILTSIPAA